MKKMLCILLLVIFGCREKESKNHIKGFFIGVEYRNNKDIFYSIAISKHDPDTLLTVYVDSTSYRKCEKIDKESNFSTLVTMELVKIDSTKTGRYIYSLSNYKSQEAEFNLDGKGPFDDVIIYSHCE